MPAASSSWFGPDRDLDGAPRRPQWDRPAKPKPRDPWRVPSATPPPPPRVVSHPAANAGQTAGADGTTTRRPRGGKKITAARQRREQAAMQAEDKLAPGSANAPGDQPQTMSKEETSQARTHSKSRWWHSSSSWWSSSSDWWQDRATNTWSEWWNRPARTYVEQGAQAPPRTPARWANQIGATARIHQRAILRIPGPAAAKAKPKAAAKTTVEPPAAMEEEVPSPIPTTEEARLSRLLDRPLQVEPEQRKRRRNKIATP